MATGNYTTLSRTKMLEYLTANSDKAVNIQDIHHFLIEAGYGVNITTIYRYMDKLTKEGRVMKYTSKEGHEAVYQLADPKGKCGSHLHLQCTKCGSICHLDEAIMKKFEEGIKTDCGFSIQCNNSLIYGVCDKCSV